jgi:uncharacterized protein
VVVASHDRDLALQIEQLIDAGHRVAMLGFPEAMNGVYAELGVRTNDIEYDAKAFIQRLPRIRVIPLAEFNPEEFWTEVDIGEAYWFGPAPSRQCDCVIAI